MNQVKPETKYPIGDRKERRRGRRAEADPSGPFHNVSRSSPEPECLADRVQARAEFVAKHNKLFSVK